MSAHRHDHDAPETVRRAEGWVDALRRQQHREMRRTGLGTEGQFHGAMAGTVIGGLLGAVLGLLVGWFFLEDLDTVWRIVLSLVLGAAAGAAAGFVYLGGRTPELENETLTAQGEPQIGSSPRDPRRDDRGR